LVDDVIGKVAENFVEDERSLLCLQQAVCHGGHQRGSLSASVVAQRELHLDVGVVT